MSTPPSLSNEEIDVLHQLAQPIAWGQRQQFLEAVTDALAVSPQPGPGGVYRAARDIQRNFTLSAQRATEIGNSPRHLTPRSPVQV